MWVPSTGAESEAAITVDELRASATFDAKAALPPTGRSNDVAKDIGAMAAALTLRGTSAP
jgi:hypothetical protein